MIDFRFDNANILIVIANFAVSIVMWALWALWVFGIRFGKEKRAIQAQREKAFREDQDEKWREYRRKNTKLVTRIYETVGRDGTVYSRDIYSWIEDPGKRSIAFALGLLLVSVIVAYVFKKTIDLNIFLGGGLVALTGYIVWKKFSKYLLYDRWYMRLIYSIACYTLFMIAVANIIDNIKGGDKV